MFTLGIPISQYRRTTRVLQHGRSTPIDFDFQKQDKDFYIFEFSDIGIDEFKSIIYLLKRNGVTTIGADDQLTERKIMKLTDLIEQYTPDDVERPSQGFEQGDALSSADDIIDKLKYILKVWEEKEYNSDKERYEEYYMDIEDLVTDYEENQSIDRPDVSINESKIQLKDFFINEQKTYGDLSPEEFDDMRANMGIKTDDEGNRYIDDPDAPPVDQLVKGNVEKIMVKLGGDAKTELKVSNYLDKNERFDLSNVTLEFNDKKYEGLEFEYEDEMENHGNVKVLLFTAEAEDGTMFEVEVDVPGSYHSSGVIDDVNWRSLETFPSEEDQQGTVDEIKNIKKGDIHKYKKKPTDPASSIFTEEGCTEQEIAEGTCGHAPDGDIDVHNTMDMEPAGPDLIAIFEKALKKLK